MRGLTHEEVYILESCIIGGNHEENDFMDDREEVVAERLNRRRLLRGTEGKTEDYEYTEWKTTPLGILALRLNKLISGNTL